MNNRSRTSTLSTILLNAILLASASISMPAVSAENLSVGVRLLGAAWEGDNGSAANDFSSDRGGQFGINVSYSNERFYTGLNLQGGSYDFTGIAPDQFNTTGRVPVGTARVKQNDFDLLFGYYIWPQVSVFADIKSVGNRWSNNAYEQNFSGLGLGITGFIPQNERWTLFGSFGFIAAGEIKDKDDNRVGDGTSTALEAGALYKLDDQIHLNMGFKFRNYAFEHNNGSQQDYAVNAVFIGITRSFSLD